MKKRRNAIVWAVLAVVVVATLAFAATANSAKESRSAQLADEIRCPTCAGLSVAESNSPLANLAKEEIDRRVSEGQSNDEIRSYFVSRYGETALMSPERRGLTLFAWLAPVVFGVLAVGAIAYTVRRWNGRPVLDEEPVDIIDARQIDREPALVDSAEPRQPEGDTGPEPEVAQPEAIDETMSPILPAMATQTLVKSDAAVTAVAQARSEIDDIVVEPVAESVVTAVERKPRSKKPFVIAVVVVALVAGAVFGVVQASDTKSTPELTVPQLLARAQQESAQGKAADSLRTYDQIIERDPNNVAALAYRGWLIRLAGLPEDGLASVQRAIAVDPEYPDAHFFKGIILLRDKNQPADAVPELEKFLASNPPEETRALVQQALTDAKTQAAAQKG